MGNKKIADKSSKPTKFGSNNSVLSRAQHTRAELPIHENTYQQFETLVYTWSDAQPSESLKRQ